ncbi:acetyl-CoA carboxylase biotin carboxyl carrier protein subunit [Tengunoibacter tsumagoiensis]|uniref:Lipoyl-binding domain-containing protein n=1 Tax=Tengunoibacter tsumagoiensis TaxID=2014871 RepID=A0A402A7J8_9CHLR|nr:acetyl-CoA carboxylase biotin carboxyl carrier protein subunit [Tengunoibacter tsumagoiensis]GCE15019.1 hypothetical protein KTT_48780 [Tengunoibacter tsumagoiensis]
MRELSGSLAQGRAFQPLDASLLRGWLHSSIIGIGQMGIVIILVIMLLISVIRLQQRRAAKHRSEDETFYHLSICIPDMNPLGEGHILLWHVAKGETIRTGQSLVTVQAERYFDIQAPHHGVLLEIKQEEGKKVDAGDVLCVIGVKIHKR